MKVRVAVLILTTLLSGGRASAPAMSRVPPSSSDDQTIQGEWVVVSIDDGVKDRLNWLKGKGVGTVLTIKNGSVALKGEEPGVTFSLIPSQLPKQIDVVVGDLTYKGIYQVDEKSLKICLPNRVGDSRPTKFEATEGGPWLYIVLKRHTQGPSK